MAAGDLPEVRIFDFQCDRPAAQARAIASSPDFLGDNSDLFPRSFESENIFEKGVLGADRLALAVRFHRTFVDPARNRIIKGAGFAEIPAQKFRRASF